jgi:hypothetical protein
MIRRVLVPVLLVAIVDAVMLLSAAANRTGPPDAQVTLTSRQLATTPASARDSARELVWTGNGVDARRGILFGRLDAGKAPALGFDARPAARQLNRRVFAALEFDGARLQIVDAALDAETLRRSHPDRGRHIVVRAVAYGDGRIRALLPELVVPREFVHMVDRPPYTVTLAFGRHYEPWIVAIAPVDTPPVRQ